MSRDWAVDTRIICWPDHRPNCDLGIRILAKEQEKGKYRILKSTLESIHSKYCKKQIDYEKKLNSDKWTIMYMYNSTIKKFIVFNIRSKRNILNKRLLITLLVEHTYIATVWRAICVQLPVPLGKTFAYWFLFQLVNAILRYLISTFFVLNEMTWWDLDWTWLRSRFFK